jgi:ketosteroid isomerase-like protein
MNLREPVQSDDLEAVRQWFDTLSKHCRAVDYEGARPIFSDDMIAFGTFTDFMIGRQLAEQKQWRNVWGTIRNFRFDLDKIEAIVSADRLTAVGMGVWQSDGFHPNGDRFDRPGRTTVVLGRRKVGDPFVATHTHMSLFRGTPERSYGNFQKSAVV